MKRAIINYNPQIDTVKGIWQGMYLKGRDPEIQQLGDNVGVTAQEQDHLRQRPESPQARVLRCKMGIMIGLPLWAVASR